MGLIKEDTIIAKAEYIPTPSFFLNHLFKGGLESGRIHTFWGREGSGKTTMALKTAVEAQKMGYVPIIVDTERALDEDRIEKDCGIQRPYFWIKKNSVEDILKEVLPLMREEGSKYFLIIDSVNLMFKDAFFKNDDSQGGLAMPSRSQTEFCMKIINVLTNNHVVVFLAQGTMDLSSQMPGMKGKFAQMVGHVSSNIVKFLPSMSTSGNDPATLRNKGDKTILYQEVLWEIQKSKQGPLAGTKGSYRFYPMTAQIDSDREIVKLAARLGIVDASSQGWLKIDGKSLREKEVMKMLKDDADFREIITDRIKESPGTYIDMLHTSELEEDA